MIPLLLIPQMILCGLLFSFDKLNNIISTKGKVPIVADMMASRWAFEALAVYQFKNNSYEYPYYDLEKIESQTDFKSSFLVDELDKKRKFIAENINEKNDSIRLVLQKDLNIIENRLRSDYFQKGLESDLVADWTLAGFTPEFNKKLEGFFAAYKKFYQEAYNRTVAMREKLIFQLESDKTEGYKLNDYKNLYYNESLADLVQNVNEKNRIIEFNGALIQQINPIFLDPAPANALDYRAHFFSPEKNLFGATVSTFLFNVIVIWIMAILLYVTLYFELLRKLLTSFEGIQERLKRTSSAFGKKK